jgi:hypothetical protein
MYHRNVGDTGHIIMAQPPETAESITTANHRENTKLGKLGNLGTALAFSLNIPKSVRFTEK